MEHLVANSGIQFIVKEVEFNPTQALVLPGGKTLRYSFVEDQIDQQTLLFDIACNCWDNNGNQVFIPSSEIKNADSYLTTPNGLPLLDNCGVLQIQPGASINAFTNYLANDRQVFSVSALSAYMVSVPGGIGKVSAFELLIDKWLPMPMFEVSFNGLTDAAYPMAWCRVKIENLGPTDTQGNNKYRFIWAFDTKLSSAFTDLRPMKNMGVNHTTYGLCNMASLMLEFMSSTNGFSAFSDYIYSLLGQPHDIHINHYKGFYIYLVNFIRCVGASPDIILHSGNQDIPVDMVLDIGNSRTCGMLFEKGDFTKAIMLSLRNLSHPEKVENKSFDMRLVFRTADFGNDIVLPDSDSDVFYWKSFVRIGEEAKQLVYKSSHQNIGLSSKTTSYSSPKRYLWDNKPFDGDWENLITVDDPTNVAVSKNVYIPDMSDLFDKNGEYLPNGNAIPSQLYSFSRSSLMTFVMIEIFQQAISQMNSVEFRTHHGEIDKRRVIRNIIITCPTAMPLLEQRKLRKCAENAYDAIRKCDSTLSEVIVHPSSKNLTPTGTQVWSYDEATCCQMVYLYAEIDKKYSGDIFKFFDRKGHIQTNGKKSLTVGSVDIGAGTTDIMVCTYESSDSTANQLIPNPLYWDSFYLAGDDILKNIVQNIIIEGESSKMEQPSYSIANVLTSELLRMTDDDLKHIVDTKDPIVQPVYALKINNIINARDENDKRDKISDLAGCLVHDFFGKDSSMMSFESRQCRLDFNTQISVPIAQFFLENLRLNRPKGIYSFGDIFSETRPSDFVLDHFKEHFGINFEDLVWSFDPQQISSIVKSTMEPMLKQIAVILNGFKCDVILMAGRPASLETITELFVKYIPVSPHNLIRLNRYKVGSWFPTADGNGYLYDQKPIVAVGGMIGYLASQGGLSALSFDFSTMIQKMKSTARYIGEYDVRRQQVQSSLLRPNNFTVTFTMQTSPIYLGCKQFDSELYQARPLYSLHVRNGGILPLKITVERDYNADSETISIQDVQNSQYVSNQSWIELVQQSIAGDGSYWLDKGEFEF